MSRLSEILGVPEGVEFIYPGSDRKYMVNGIFLQSPQMGNIWLTVTGTADIYRMIAQPDFIKAISSNKYNLTDQQITAIKGRIAEGTPWAARDISGGLFFCENKPYLSKDQKYFWSPTCGFSSKSNLYDFITYDNSPVYLPDLIEGASK